MNKTTQCCDLLSDLFFAIFNNNWHDVFTIFIVVVICFQICSLLYLTTIAVTL